VAMVDKRSVQFSYLAVGKPQPSVQVEVWGLANTSNGSWGLWAFTRWCWNFSKFRTTGRNTWDSQPSRRISPLSSNDRESGRPIHPQVQKHGHARTGQRRGGRARILQRQGFVHRLGRHDESKTASRIRGKRPCSDFTHFPFLFKLDVNPIWLHSVFSPIHFAPFPIPKRDKGNPAYWLQFTTLGGWVVECFDELLYKMATQIS
jgi:hypothetical protein